MYGRGRGQANSREVRALGCIHTSVAMAQPRFFQKMDTVFQIKLPLF